MIADLEAGDGPRQPPHACGGCPARWSGSNQAHCATCHKTFSGPTGFDKHRKDGRCREPGDVGMVEQNRGTYVTWGSPGGEYWKTED